MEQLGGRRMPFSAEAEQSVLGSVLIDPEKLTDITNIVHAEDFYLREHAQEGDGALCVDGETSLPVPTMTYGREDDPAAQAAHVFACLRQADERGFRTLYVSCPSEEGMGLAVYNRLLRAAAFEVIELG